MASAPKECDDHNVVPTVSTSIAMAIERVGRRAYAGTLSDPEDFAMHHPAGQLGRNLVCMCAT